MMKRRHNKELDRTKSVLARRTTAFAGQFRRSPDQASSNGVAGEETRLTSLAFTGFPDPNPAPEFLSEAPTPAPSPAHEPAQGCLTPWPSTSAAGVAWRRQPAGAGLRQRSSIQDTTAALLTYRSGTLAHRRRNQERA